MGTELAKALSAQRLTLQISVTQIAKLAKVSRSTVSRLLSGDVDGCSIATVNAVCDVLGVEIGVKSTNPNRLHNVARQKAERLARSARGSCALESQTIDEDTFAKSIEAVTQKLLNGSRAKLWAS